MDKNIVNGKTCIYRMYDNKECVYVGITNDMHRRFQKHKKDKEWIINISRIEYSRYMNRNTAKIYEIYYISKLKPKYNIAHMSHTGGFDVELDELNFTDFEYAPENKNAGSEDGYKSHFILSLLDDYIRFKSIQGNEFEWYILDENKIRGLFETCNVEESKMFKTVSKTIQSLSNKYLLSYSGFYDTYYDYWQHQIDINNMKEDETSLKKDKSEHGHDNKNYDKFLECISFGEGYDTLNINKENVSSLQLRLSIQDSLFVDSGHRLVDYTIKK